MPDEACAARAISDEMVCIPCGLRWGRGDVEKPACSRKDRLPNGDLKLTAADVRALQLGEAHWLTRRRNGYAARGTPLVKLATVRRLLGLRLLMAGPRGGLRTTYQGTFWLKRNGSSRGESRDSK